MEAWWGSGQRRASNIPTGSTYTRKLAHDLVLDVSSQNRALASHTCTVEPLCVGLWIAFPHLCACRAKATR
jgi:hypothetical protein